MANVFPKLENVTGKNTKKEGRIDKDLNIEVYMGLMLFDESFHSLEWGPNSL